MNISKKKLYFFQNLRKNRGRVRVRNLVHGSDDDLGANGNVVDVPVDDTASTDAAASSFVSGDGISGANARRTDASVLSVRVAVDSVDGAQDVTAVDFQADKRVLNASVANAASVAVIGDGAEAEAHIRIIGNLALPRHNAALASPTVVRLSPAVVRLAIFGGSGHGASLLDLELRARVNADANGNAVDGKSGAREHAAVARDNGAEAQRLESSSGGLDNTVLSTAVWHL